MHDVNKVELGSPSYRALVLVEYTPSFNCLVAQDDEERERGRLDKTSAQTLDDQTHALLSPEYAHGMAELMALKLQ